MKYRYAKEQLRKGKGSIYPDEPEGTNEIDVFVNRRKVAIVWKFANDDADHKYVVWLLPKYSCKDEEMYLATVVSPSHASKSLDNYFSKVKKVAKELEKMS